MTEPTVSTTALPWYLASSSVWLVGMTLQGFLVAWMLAGLLQVSAFEYGISRALIEIPPMLMLLLGGIWGDRSDSRKLLTITGVLIAIPPIIFAFLVDYISYWGVVLFSMTIAMMQSLSDPARQSIISRVTRTDIQRTITLVTVVTTFVGLGGFWIGGKLELFGLSNVLILEAGAFLLSIIAIRKLPRLPALRNSRTNLNNGLRLLWNLPLVRNVIALNFVSSLFNAGAYIVGMPYIVTQIYEGDAAFYATTMMWFTVGSIGSNLLLLLIMPLKYPGRLFLIFQLTRIVILVGLWFQPPSWLFFLLVMMWGVNMGITSTLVRTTVQELAPPSDRTQILGFLLFSFMVSSPISALILGALIASTDPMTALLPGIPISLFIFGIGLFASGLWNFKSSRQ